MDNYDAIVVGAGNGGLISALSLINKEYRVLLLDDHNNVGGMSKTSMKGRFEFGDFFQNIYLNNNEYSYSINNILKELNIEEEIEFSLLPDSYRILTFDRDINMPLGVESYKNKIIELVPESEESLNVFFSLALECREALNYIVNNRGSVDEEFIKNEYDNFRRVSSYSVSKVLDAIDMPIAAQELINSLWIFLGSSETDISFVTYTNFLLNILENGLMVPSNKSYDIVQAISSRFLELGGEIKLNSKVINLLVDDGKINGVKLADGTTYFSNNVIVNSNLENVYAKLIKPDEVPREALKNVNKRELGGRTFTVHLGLNRSAEELGLKDYLYIITSSLDTDVEFRRMKEIANGNQISIVHNNANKSASPEGTCYITLSTVYFDDCFADYVEETRYFVDVKEITQRLIDVFEKYTKTRIYEYIEEIEVISPVDNVIFNDCPDGCMFGYKLKGLDDLLPRILNKHNENYIDGLYVCSGFDGDIYGYGSSFVAGIDCANLVIKNIEGDE